MKLDQHDLRQIKLKDIRRHIALVLQDSVILPTTIAENIAYGCPTATLEQIREAARLAAANFIEALPDQYQTALLDSGMNLSGGQRQRIALARALLTKAPILVRRTHQLSGLRTRASRDRHLEFFESQTYCRAGQPSYRCRDELRSHLRVGSRNDRRRRQPSRTAPARRHLCRDGQAAITHGFSRFSRGRLGWAISCRRRLVRLLARQGPCGD